ncbi:hypothetical protein NQ317_005217 [Molorchus minor]|uniref:Protein ELYS n=1 Tax=Molorchus minor TaxID=1323400 RepID=A0ABQ9JRI2_9CUCU|nr:hypothetical protein NQ317_005217 [Molorchus minor]
MSFKVTKILQFPQPISQYLPQDDPNTGSATDLPTLSGVLAETRYVWHAKGPCLEIRDARTGVKVGAWIFGSILKDSNTRVMCVDEIERPNGRLSLLAVGVECGIAGSMICIFEVFGSKVLRAIHIKEKVTTLHVVDSGYEVLNLPGPLRNFDGIVAVGTEEGNVYLIDICRQICEEALYAVTLKDELNPCQLILLTVKDISRIEYYKERSVRDGDHLAIHLNVVINSLTQHFTLKGPGGEDRIHVNREEVITSALYYCPQLTSLLVGFNFGAFQLWNLTNLKLVYTSPICKGNIPITHFALQEPADDPRAFCYIWVAYSNIELHQTGLPFAVMYSLCYDSKEYHEGYGYLYQDFQTCSVRFQVELGALDDHRTGLKPPKGGCCTGLRPICKAPAGKELYSHDATGDTLALCVISWTIWYNQNELKTNTLLFDLNQWYKEQMPDFTNWSGCSNYMLRINVSDLAAMTGRKGAPFLDVKMDKKFIGVQRLEEHFCPSALSFDLWGVRENDVVSIHSEGVQRALLAQIEAAGPLCLIRPNDVCRQIISVGLTPLFTDLSLSTSVSVEVQRETILNVSLEQQLVAWLCKCALEWANGSFSSAGCSLDFLLHWAFQRAIVLKNNCDKYCMPLFDHSQIRLDNNTSILLNSCIRQINSLCTFFSYVINKLDSFISNLETVLEQQTSLKMVSTYFEVLEWLMNVGLLPECPPSTYAAQNIDKISAPYPIQELANYYHEKRAQLCLLSKDSFASSDSLLFIDNLISNKCGAELLQKQWQEDGGSGLYPPPSLQSMLRTYLVEGADINHKHSLVIYVFLDLAMALEQNKYAPSSIIKITQAFWQLDHGDYTTAMEQLLDPFVLGDDLEPWHHAIAMRALLLQNQYNFALLYMQVRKPPVTCEKDILTAISLFIANGMLDEAFYFKNQHQNNNQERLLMHLYNECNKNDSLHVLLYRCLSTDEERTFFKYLKSVDNPTADDLQVFYYLLRSRFVEAFDTHDSSKRKKPESQGLIGQRNATKTDQIVRIFKTLLPDVNRQLVDVVRKERTNLWKEVGRPTPLSVFVHNTEEHVHYKSTLIQAALSKAKRTFSDSLDNTRIKEILTEETPFLRTPKASKAISRHPTPVITPKFIEVSESGQELDPSPAKRLKLTPRASTTSPTWSRMSSLHSKMLTPIVKRKTSIQNDQSIGSSGNICTPQSILKVRKLVCNADDPMDNTFGFEGLSRIETSPRKSALGLQPRRCLSQTHRRTQVKFDDAARFSSSLSDQSNKQSLNNTSFEEKSTLSSKDVSLMISSKNSSTSNTDEAFYSPDSSFSEAPNTQEVCTGTIKINVLREDDVTEPMVDDSKLKSRINETGDVSLGLQSPKARRSYKRSLREMSPVRSSPRLNRTIHNEKIETDIEKEPPVIDRSLDKTKTSTESDLSKEESLEPDNSSPLSQQSPRPPQKIKGRKSLSRQVLEHNTFSKILSAAPTIPLTRSETSISTEKITVTEKTEDVLEVTTMETKIECSDVSNLEHITPKSGHRRYVSSSTSKRKVFESSSLESDTSGECNMLFDSPKLPESLKISPSLIEYMKSRSSKHDNNTFNDKSMETQEEGSDNEILEKSLRRNVSSLTPKREVFERTGLESDTSGECNMFFDSPKLPENLKMSSSLLEYVKSRTSKLDNNSFKGESTKTQEENLEIQTQDQLQQKVNVEEKCSEIVADKPNKKDAEPSGDDKCEITPMEVYEDLSSGAEDIEEVLSANKRDSHSSKVYTELSNCSDNTSNELEKNIFDVSAEQSFEKAIVQDQVDQSIHPNSESFYIPESEMGFIQDQTKLDDSEITEAYFSAPVKDEPREEKQPNEVIEINTSSDSEDSSSPTETSDSRISDKSDTDADDLNISYERNIHVEEDSRSFIDSQSSRSTGGRESRSEEEYIPVEIDVNIQQEVEVNDGGELDMNEDNSSVEFMDDRQEIDDEQNEQNLEQQIEPLEVLQEVMVESVNIVVDTNEGHVLVEEAESVEIEAVQENYEPQEYDGDVQQMEESEIRSNEHELLIFAEKAQNAINPEVEIQESEVLIQESTSEDKTVTPVVTEPIKDDIEQKFMLQEPTSEDKIASDGAFEKQSDQSPDQPPLTTVNQIYVTIDRKPETKEEETNTTVNEMTDKNTSVPNEEVGKKNQATNTTLLVPAEQDISDARNLIDATAQTSQTNVKPNETILVTDRPKERKVYHPKYGAMKVVEDQTGSSISSDTTEGEALNREIVVTAQVHTPSRRKTEMPLIKRVTRRSSALLSQTAEPDILESVESPVVANVSSYDILDEEYQTTLRQTPQKKGYVSDILDDSSLVGSDDVLTPGYRTRRSKSVTLSPHRTVKTRRSLYTDDRQDFSQPSTSKDPDPEPPRNPRRTRSASVDETIPSVRKRSLRRSSTEEKSDEEVKTKVRGKASSVSQLPVISEENKANKSRPRGRASSSIDAYATTRRLTRRQASMVKGMETPSSVTAQDDSDVEKVLDVDAIDPIKLLDKEPFEGKPDPDEEKIYEQSSPSNSTVSSFTKPARRTSRSASMASDSSLPPSVSRPSTPKKTKKSVEPPSPSGVKTRSRKQSETSSVTSEKSEPHTPPKRAKKKDADDTGSGASATASTRTKGTRSRANSASSAKSDKSASPKRVTRGRRLVSAKSDLPEIVEEKSNEPVDTSDKPVRRRTRK